MAALVGITSDYGPEDEDQPAKGQGASASDDDEQLAGTDDPEAAEEDAVLDDPEGEQQQPKTITVKLTADDGTETEKQVTLDELKSGYMMKADYTRKTQALARERTEVVQAYTQDVQRFAQEAQQTAQQARAVLQAVLGQRSPQEMYQLSMTDPAQHAVELARQNMFKAALEGLDHEQQQLATQAQQRLAQQQQEMLQRSRQALIDAKVTAKDLSAISEHVPKYYGFTREELESVKDHRIVLALRDAIQFRQLKSAKPEVLKRTTNVAPMPRTGKAPEPQQLRASRELNQRFQSGNAKVSDLAALISSQRR